MFQKNLRKLIHFLTCPLWLLSFVIMMATTSARTDEMNYDIVIYGGSFSAPAAALAAARTNPDAQILLVEPMDWLGGQATVEGVSAIDNAWHDPAASLMRNNPQTYYPADYLDFLNRLKNKPPEAPGEGMAPNGCAWVSREAFDPRTGAWTLEQMVSEYPNITLMKLTVVKDVATTDVVDQFGTGKKITGLTLIQRIPINGYKPFDKFLSQEILDWYDTNDSADYQKIIHEVGPRDPVKGLVVIDASELADVIILSDAVYTVGRELTTEKIADDGTLPAMDEDGSQSFVFTFCMTTTTTTQSEDEVKTDFPNFDTYYQDQVNNYFSFGSYSWTSIWTYRRLFVTGTPSSSAVYLGDVSMQNWYPGNDYPYGTMYKNKADAATEIADWSGGVNVSELTQAEMHAVCWYFYMKANKTVSWDTLFLRKNHPMNMMGTGVGLSRFPYIRCGRRMVGLYNFRITERYFVVAQTTPPTSFRYYDSVGIGCYAEDIHPTYISTGLSPTIHTPAPFYIPYRALGSTNVRNLLASGKQMGQSFLANSAYRLHPIEWVSGSAAGVAAALMTRDGKTNYALLEIPALRELQNKVNLNSPISWAAYDSSPIPPQNGDLVVNDFKQVTSGDPFQIEIYHLAVRAEIYFDTQYIGETTYKANGRLVYNVASCPANSFTLTVLCYDAEGTLIDTLTQLVEPIIVPVITGVVDNDTSGFSFTGTWTLSTSQPDRYGPNYRVCWGYSPAGTATWELDTSVAGDYEVSIFYSVHTNRATDAPYTVHYAGGQETFLVNQQVNGGMWNSLGIFHFDGINPGYVTLSNNISDTSKCVIADAVAAQITSRVTGWMLYESPMGKK